MREMVRRRDREAPALAERRLLTENMLLEYKINIQKLVAFLYTHQ